jgi:hypothetical protein
VAVVDDVVYGITVVVAVVLFEVVAVVAKVVVGTTVVVVVVLFVVVVVLGTVTPESKYYTTHRLPNLSVNKIVAIIGTRLMQEFIELKS